VRPLPGAFVLSQPPENTNQTRIAPTDGLCEFFLVITPGFEELAQKEIFRWIAPGTPTTVERGGLTVRLPLIEGCALNRVLKIPTRILLRLADFGCRDFPKLFKKTAGLPWQDWIPDGSTVEFQASSHKSRLSIKKRIEETCLDGFKKYLKSRDLDVNQAAKVKQTAATELLQVMVRFDDDVCTISLDTSGELLHKRGTKRLSAEAPLRETIAAALLEFMNFVGPVESDPVTLIDPMVGSGTFAIEAAHLGSIISSRTFAFESFPRYLRESGESPVEKANAHNERERSAVPFAHFIGIDIDPKAAEAARGNWRSLGDKRDFKVEVADIFEAKPLVIEGKRWLVTNPPYGERLKVEGRLKDYYELLFEACERVTKPDRACFLLPNTADPERLKFPRRWELTASLEFQNGGLPVTALLFSGAGSGVTDFAFPKVR
jgi:putative N6-adenine-specific DNA methylase